MKPLTETPHQVIIMADDAAIVQQLEQMELLDEARKYEAVVKTFEGPKQGFKLYHFKHQTHWILIDFFLGFANPADNGYCLIAVPKSKYSKEQFMRKLPENQNFNRIKMVIRSE